FLEFRRFMDAKGGFEVSLLTGPALQAQVDVLAFATLGDPTKDVVVKSVDQGLGGALSDVAKSESFEGKSGHTLSLHPAGKLGAKRVVVVGGGPRGDFSNAHSRDVTAAVAQLANKAGAVSVGFMVPPVGANREATLVQMAVEGIFLGTYKFSRYLTGE